MLKFRMCVLPVVFALSACGGSSSSSGGKGEDDTPIDIFSLPREISWEPPTQNTDNSDLTDLVKYRFYYGPDASSLKAIPELDLDAKGGTASSLNVLSLSPDNLNVLTQLVQDNDSHFFAMTAINSQNIESSFSEIVQWVQTN